MHKDDFSDNFSKLTYREAKVNKLQHNRPLIEPLADMCRLYVKTCHKKFREGYLFHHYTRLKTVDLRPFMDIKTAGAFLTKLRRDIGKEYPQIMERYVFETDSGSTQTRYRVSFHSLRRWFETNLKEKSDVYVVKEIMNYSKYEVLNSYLNRANVMTREKEILSEAFNPIAREVMNDRG